jgi:hypothetical protein
VRVTTPPPRLVLIIDEALRPSGPRARGGGGGSVGFSDGASMGGSVGGGSMFGSRQTSGAFGSSGGTTG